MSEDRAAAEADVVTKPSRQSVAGTVAKLTAMISAKGMRLFAVIDSAAGASNGSPCMDADTGSTTSGTVNESRRHVAATVPMMLGDASMPVLAAWMPMSVTTASICAATTSSGTS